VSRKIEGIEEQLNASYHKCSRGTNTIKNEHSKIIMQLPFRTDIRGEINTDNNRAIYINQYPYPVSLRFRY